MKKTLVALAALAVVGAASAQSTVTLYGKIDATVVNRTEKVDGVKTANNVGMEVNSAGLSGSRFGMRGTEDLGGGLKANFQLEQGFNIDNGAASNASNQFNRQAWVGLSGAFGSVTVGRQYTPMDNQWGANDPQGYSSNSAMGWVWNSGSLIQGGISAAAITAATTAFNGFGGFNALLGFHAEAGRVNNSIMYMTPAMGGFSGQLMYAPGENKNPVAGQSAGNYVGASVAYAAGPLGVSLAYESTKATRATVADGKFSAWSLMGQYDLGVAKLFGGFENGKASGVAGFSPVGLNVAGKDSGWLFGGTMPIGAMTLALGYAREKSKDTVGGGLVAKKSGFGGQLVYPLSKRTNVYADFLSAKVKATDGVDSINVKNSIFGVGLRHDF